ncbi:MAG: hypothetical protein Q9M89_05130 [Persephonella sp.]|nr:hypothetical protein [Persephonella sp.]
MRNGGRFGSTNYGKFFICQCFLQTNGDNMIGFLLHPERWGDWEQEYV